MSSGLPGMDLVALRQFLTARAIEVTGELRAELISGGRSNLTFLVTDGVSRWVVRRPPIAGLTASAHDMKREWRVISALRHTAVPVPPTIALCDDPSVLGASFTVTGHVAGRVFRSREDIAGVTDDALRRGAQELVRVLVNLHTIDATEVGLEDFGRPAGYLDRQIALWRRQWDKVKTRELEDVSRLHGRLAEAIPAGPCRTGIVHGDYRIDNTILAADDVTSVRAVLDWELSTLGDPLTDVALMCVYRQPVLDVILGMPAAWTSDQLPSPAELAEEYARQAGVHLDDWPFYLGLANFKLAVIAEGIAYRARQAATVDGMAARAAHATPELIAAGLCAL